MASLRTTNTDFEEDTVTMTSGTHLGVPEVNGQPIATCTSRKSIRHGSVGYPSRSLSQVYIAKTYHHSRI